MYDIIKEPCFNKSTQSKSPDLQSLKQAVEEYFNEQRFVNVVDKKVIDNSIDDDYIKEKQEQLMREIQELG